MLLSEAIRLGAMLRPQGTGAYFSEKGYTVGWNSGPLFQAIVQKQIVSCAMGAAAEAAGCQTASGVVDVFRKLWPFALEVVPDLCPACGDQIASIGITATLVHLNDKHSWPREEIADWVATIEPAEKAEKAEKIGETVENTELIAV